MSISVQSIRKKGGRAEARGAQSRIQASDMVERIIEGIDHPKRTQKPRKPSKHELDYMITQAYEAVHNFPDSVPARKRLEGLLAYKESLK